MVIYLELLYSYEKNNLFLFPTPQTIDFITHMCYYTDTTIITHGIL